MGSAELGGTSNVTGWTRAFTHLSLEPPTDRGERGHPVPCPRDDSPRPVVTELLKARQRPEWLSPTITITSDADVVFVEALACGVNEMLRRLSMMTRKRSAADTTARELLGN